MQFFPAFNFPVKNTPRQPGFNFTVSVSSRGSIAFAPSNKEIFRGWERPWLTLAWVSLSVVKLIRDAVRFCCAWFFDAVICQKAIMTEPAINRSSFSPMSTGSITWSGLCLCLTLPSLMGSQWAAGWDCRSTGNTASQQKTPFSPCQKRESASSPTSEGPFLCPGNMPMLIFVFTIEVFTRTVGFRFVFSKLNTNVR